MDTHSQKIESAKKVTEKIKRLHTTQIILEVLLTVLLLSLITINVRSTWPLYGQIEAYTLILSALAIFVFAIIISVQALGIHKTRGHLENEVENAELRGRVIWMWVWVPIFILVTICSDTIAQRAPSAVKSGAALIIIALFFIGLVWLLITIHSLWKAVFEEKRKPFRLFMYAGAGAILILIAVFAQYTTTDTLKYSSRNESDINLELGQTEIKQSGKDGTKLESHNLLFGFVTSTSQTDPTDQINSVGTRRYQYMYCSTGGYRYYSADNFKNPNVGFTHQSPDYCAQNNEGTETTIADVPPPQKQTTYVPTYTAPMPTTTHCYELYSTFNCYSY